MITLKNITDIEILLLWRKEVIETVFGISPDIKLIKANEEYYRKHIADGSHKAYIVLYNGIEAGCGSVCLSEELPSPDNPTGKCAYLMNIYVRKNFREMGLGHAIVKKLIDVAKNLECDKIYLETTDLGRHLYESLGFHDLPDMMKLSDKHDDKNKY